MAILFTLQEMSLLEVKHGLLQIAESLDFLHNNARLIHRAISPEVTTCLLNYFLSINFLLSGRYKLYKLESHIYFSFFLILQVVLIKSILFNTVLVNRDLCFWFGKKTLSEEEEAHIQTGSVSKLLLSNYIM